MHGHTHNRTRTAGPRGFTLIELLVVVVIIAILVSVLLVGVRAAFKASQRVADQQAARALNNAIQQFESDNGFLPPLVYDGDPFSATPLPKLSPPAQFVSNGYQWVSNNDRNAPVIEVASGSSTTRFLGVYNKSADIDFFRGGKDAKGNNVVTVKLDTPGSGRVSDTRYSKFSLPIYLSGVLDRDVDGRAGAGITQPFQDGTFAGVTGEGSPRPVDAIIEPTNEILNVTQTYADDLEAGEHSGRPNLDAVKGRPFATAFTDRYGRAFRYYRWEPGRNTVDAANPSEIGRNARAKDLNIPFLLQDPLLFLEQQTDPEVDATGGSAELRGARYAIVAAGPDGFFGTEAYAKLDVAGAAVGSPEAMTQRRAEVMKDNIVVIEP